MEKMHTYLLRKCEYFNTSCLEGGGINIEYKDVKIQN